MGKTLYINIYDTTVRVVQKNSMQYTSIECIELFGGKEISDDTVENVKQNLKATGIAGKRAVIGMCTTGMMVRTDRVPKMSTKVLNKVVSQNIANYFPAISIEEYEWQYNIVNELTENSTHYYEIAVTAIKRVQIERAMSLMSKLGLKVTRIDALPNMLMELKYDIEARNVMILDGNSNGVHLMLLKGCELVTYAMIPFTVRDSELQDEESLYNEIRGYIDYYKSRNQGESVDSIVVLGVLGMISSFILELKQKFNITVINKYTSESLYTTIEALESIESDRNKTNFIPTNILRAKKSRENSIATILILILYIGTMSILNYGLRQYKMNKAEIVQNMQEENNKVREEIKELSSKDYDSQLKVLKQGEKLQYYSYNITNTISSISKIVPSSISLTGIYVKHVQEEDSKAEVKVEDTEVNSELDTENNVVAATEAPKSKVKKKEITYEKVPNVLVIDGETDKSAEVIGLFVNKLSGLQGFTQVNLKSINNADSDKLSFTIEMVIKLEEK